MRNLCLSGGFAHPFDDTSAALADLLTEVGIDTEITEDLETGIARSAAGEFEMVTLNLLRWRMLADRFAPHRQALAYQLPAVTRAQLTEFVRRGGRLLAMHAASICFDDWEQWWELLGARWNWERSGHPPLGRMQVRITAPHHPLVAGVGDFEVVDEAYGFLDEQPDLEPLLTSAHGGRDHPLLWVRPFGAGRVAYDALGHDLQSYDSPQHREILRRTAAWLTEPTVPEEGRR